MLRGGVGTHPAGAPRPRGAGPRAGARRGWDGADPAPPAARPRPRAPARRAAALAIAQSDGLSSSAGLSILSVWREGLSMVCFRRVTNRGRGARGGADIGGNARSPGWNASRCTPDAVHSSPPPPEARRTRPRCSPSGQHSNTPAPTPWRSAGCEGVDVGEGLGRWDSTGPLGSLRPAPAPTAADRPPQKPPKRAVLSRGRFILPVEERFGAVPPGGHPDRWRSGEGGGGRSAPRPRPRRARSGARRCPYRGACLEDDFTDRRRDGQWGMEGGGGVRPPPGDSVSEWLRRQT